MANNKEDILRQIKRLLIAPSEGSSRAANRYTHIGGVWGRVYQAFQYLLDKEFITTVEDGTVTFEKLADEFTAIDTTFTTEVDFDSAFLFKQTVSSNLTLTFTNLKVGIKYIKLIGSGSGSYSITLPGYCTVLSGSYNDLLTNYIQLHCINSESGNEEVLVSIVNY